MPSLAVEAKPSADLYREHVNPQWARLLDVLQMNVRYTRCLGAELRAEGRRVLDFLSGYCVHNTGHDHPYIVQSIQRELLRNGPGTSKRRKPFAARRAQRLCSMKCKPECGVLDSF